MKKTILLLLLAMLFTLSACVLLGQTLAESAEPTITDSASLQIDETPAPQTDWRDDAAISAHSTMELGGEPIDICVCVEDYRVLLYRDEPAQVLLTQGD